MLSGRLKPSSKWAKPPLCPSRTSTQWSQRTRVRVLCVQLSRLSSTNQSTCVMTWTSSSSVSGSSHLVSIKLLHTKSLRRTTQHNRWSKWCTGSCFKIARFLKTMWTTWSSCFRMQDCVKVWFKCWTKLAQTRDWSIKKSVTTRLATF